MKKATIIAMLLTVSLPSYAFIPKKDFLNQAFLTDNIVYLKDKESNHWQLVTDCNLDLKLSDKPQVDINSRLIREGARVTIRTEKDIKKCRIDSLVKL